jgi:hypothetical protein
LEELKHNLAGEYKKELGQLQYNLATEHKKELERLQGNLVAERKTLMDQLGEQLETMRTSSRVAMELFMAKAATGCLVPTGAAVVMAGIGWSSVPVVITGVCLVGGSLYLLLTDKGALIMTWVVTKVKKRAPWMMPSSPLVASATAASVSLASIVVAS